MHPMILLSAVAALAAAPAWSACDEPTSSVAASRVRVVTDRSGDSGAAEQSVGVSVVDGKVSVTLDGRPVPDGRIRRDGARIVVLDDHGKPIANMPFIIIEPDGDGRDARVVVRTGPASGGATAVGGGGRTGAWSSADAGSSKEALHQALVDAARAGESAVAHGQLAWTHAQEVARDEARNAGELIKRYLVQLQPGKGDGEVTATAAAAPPKVMLGVNLDEPGEALRRQLRLEPGSATIMASVIDGLPASKAGLEPFDVVIEVDGRRPAGPSQLREAIAAKNPGDALRLTVIRGGDKRQFTVTLEAYDAAKLGNEGAAVVQGHDAAHDPNTLHDMLHQSLQGLDIQIEPYLRELQGTLRFAPLPRTPGAAPDAAAPRDFVYELRRPSGAAGGVPAPAPDVATERLDRLERRLDDMSLKLEKLLEKLERLDA